MVQYKDPYRATITHQLISQQKHGFQAEFTIAEVEQVLQTGSKKVQNHGIVVAFCSKPSDKWDADATS